MDDVKKLAAETYNQAFEAVEAGQDPAWAVELAATSLNLWRRVGTEQNLSIGCSGFIHVPLCLPAPTRLLSRPLGPL